MFRPSRQPGPPVEITLTQAILLYFHVIYSPPPHQRNTTLLAEFDQIFFHLLLNGVASGPDTRYIMFLQRFDTYVLSVPGYSNLAILDRDYIDIGKKHSPCESMFDYEIPADWRNHLDEFEIFDQLNELYELKPEFYADPRKFIEQHREAVPTKGLVKTIAFLRNDQSRRALETTLAINCLASLGSFVPERGEENLFDFSQKVLQWNHKLKRVLSIVMADNPQNPMYPQTLQWLKAYDTLSSCQIAPDSLKPAEEVFRDWPEDNLSVIHEIYDIINIFCKSSAERNDPRLTIDHRKLFTSIALSWLLIRAYVYYFNSTLALSNEYLAIFEDRKLRGRIAQPDELIPDRPISGEFIQKSGEESTYQTYKWPHIPLGIIQPPRYGGLPFFDERATYLSATNLGEPKHPLSKYVYPKTVDNNIIATDSVWALFCRSRKVHTLIGGGSASFFYIIRMLISAQDATKHNIYFGVPTGHALDIQHDFSETDCYQFIKIISCLWVGITGGHNFLEILFILNMPPVSRRLYKKLHMSMRIDLGSLLNVTYLQDYNSGWWRHGLRVVADFNSTLIARSLMNQSFEGARKMDNLWDSTLLLTFRNAVKDRLMAQASQLSSGAQRTHVNRFLDYLDDDYEFMSLLPTNEGRYYYEIAEKIYRYLQDLRDDLGSITPPKLMQQFDNQVMRFAKQWLTELRPE